MDGQYLKEARLFVSLIIQDEAPDSFAEKTCKSGVLLYTLHTGNLKLSQEFVFARFLARRVRLNPVY